MKIRRILALVVALTVGFGAACQPGTQMPIVSAPSGDPTDSAQALMAHGWQAQVIVSPAGGTQFNTDWPASAGRLSFHPNGLASGNMGCNYFTVDWSVPAAGQIRVEWDQLATLVFCGENTDWSAFPSTLDTVTGWEITDAGSLRLFGDQTLLEAVPLVS